ncbi:MAG: ComEC/Rec2 family competence protein, partial [Alphaproteobacteria bacterium]|nr:ComEC/Rec2 family competence protein [Alphaproteobacteria bacterium]
AITPEDWDAIRAAGLAHMLAISGLHVGIVAGLLFFVARFFMALFPSFALYHPIKKYAAVIAFAGAAGYTILAGAGVPTLRALFMTGIVLLAILLDRQAISMRTVALSALVVLLFSPDALFSASFQMSFAAVTALVFAYDAIRPWWSRLYRGAGRVRRAGMYVAGVVLTTLVAGSAVAPFSLYHFQQYPLYDIPANVLAAPLMTFLIMPGVVLSYFVMPLGLDILAFKPLEWGITGLLLIARNVYELPGATWNPPAWPVAALVCFVLGGLWVVLWQGRLRVMALFLFACGFLIISQYKQPDILVSSSGKLIAVRVDETQMRLSSKVQDRFSGENWARLLGILPEEIRSLQREGAVEGIACGPLGCRTILHGKKIALSFHPAGQKEDCAWADLLIAESSLRVKKCAAPLVRDLYDFYRDGAHSFYLSGSDVREQSVASVRGDRPWTVSNRR